MAIISTWPRLLIWLRCNNKSMYKRWEGDETTLSKQPYTANITWVPLVHLCNRLRMIIQSNKQTNKQTKSQK